MMLVDYEFEDMVKTPERIKALGFKPQSEVLANHLLPYAEDLDIESTKFLEQVKTNLGKSVMLREMKPACGVWSSRLMKYIRMYGQKFSKEDHIAFIKLAYELVLIPDLEPCKIHKFSTLFIMLAKKRYLIPPEELTLEWRPLYDMGKKIFNKSDTNIGMYHYLKPNCPKEGGDMLSMIRKFLSGSGLDDALNLFGLAAQDEKELALEGSYLSMVKCARPYFDKSATKEILEELLPQINPWTAEGYVMGQLAMFLPVALHPKYAAQGHELWLDDLLTLFDTCYNSQAGVTDLTMLFAGLAKRNPGAVDWSPHVPIMFSRIMHSLHLPVSYKDMQISKTNCIDTKHLASWIVWSINPDGVVLKHLRGFLAGVESYLQSANSGRWSFRLRDFLRKLAREFLNRVRRERKMFKPSWENKTPDSYKLRDEDITEFITIVLEPTLQAVYSRNGSLDISLAMQNLATLRPALVIPPLLEKLQNALTSLTEPHRVTVGMAAVASIARAMLRGPETGYPEGPTHVVPLLMAVLPGLDPNDIKKTFVSLHFILIFVWMVPIIDCSSAPEYYSDLTEEELLTCESTAQLEDFVLLFLDRLFVLIESSALENVRLDTKDLECFRSKTEAVMETAISSTAFAVLVQSSPKIFKEALRKFKAFATESTFETNVSGSMVGVLLKVFTRTDPASTLAAFLPKLCEELNELLTEEALVEENPSRDILYRLVLLKSAAECDGSVLLNYIPMLLPVLDKALRFNDKHALERSCEVLSNIVQYFSFIEVKDWRSSPKDYAAAPKTWLPIREWGHGCPLSEAKLKWHVPSQEEANCVQMLIDRYLKPTIEELRMWVKGEVTLSREEMYRTLSVVNASLSCGPFFPQPDEEPIALMESQVPATSIPFNTGVKYTITLDGDNVRVVLTRLLMDVQARMLADKSDDTKCFEMLIKIWEHILIVKFGRGTSSLETRLRSYNALERGMDGRGSDAKTGHGTMRLLITEAARIQDDSRADLVCEAGITPSALKALDALFELSINTYTSVRRQAQTRLYWMLSHYPYSYRVLVPKLSSLLLSIGEGEEWHARHKGALFILLGPRSAPLIARQDWESAGRLWPNLLKAPLSEKQSIHRLEQALSESLHRNFPTVNTRIHFPDTTVTAASGILSKEQLNDDAFLALLEHAEAKEDEMSDKVESCYRELLEEIAGIAEKPNVQWRRLEYAMQMLTFCPSLQTVYPPKVVKLALQSLIHDDIAVRRTALRLTHYALRQCKRELKTVDVDPWEMAGMPRQEKHVPGYRKDLEWALWSEDKVPLSDEGWEKPILRNSDYGFYMWPKKLGLAAPPSQQVFASSIRPENMTETEQYIYEFFTNDDNVNKLISFFTVEEKKGKDKFSALRFLVFKVLFSNFGTAVTSKFLPHALRCAADTQEAPQRFSAEVAAAALRAPRYWPKDQALKMYSDTADIITTGLTSVTPETMEDWGTALATGIEKLDPLRGSSLLLRLVEFCVPPATQEDVDLDQNTSFVMCARLYTLQGALGSMKWRSARIAKLVLERLEAANFIQHPYQIVREAVGSLLMTIFDNELVFPGGEKGDTPCLKDFLATVLPRLAALYDEHGDIVIKPAATTSISIGTSDNDVETGRCSHPAPPLSQLGNIALDVARLQSELTVPQDNTQAAETGDPSSDSESKGRSAGLEKQLSVRLDTALRLADDGAPPALRDHARASNLLTTVLRGCMGITVRAAHGSVRAQYVVVSAACALAGRGAAGHEELPLAAASLLAALAHQHHPPDSFDAALTELQQRAKDRSWWARLACLDLAQPLLFYGLPYLCEDANRAAKAEALALQLMRDRRLEVRQSASKLLTGLMHCRALIDEEKTLRALMRSCRSKELVERHHGVLGLCSYLASRPYSLGPKLGDVLTELARHTNAPDPIPATIRTVLAEFRRTHQDDWPKHRERLTEEELDLLADLTSPPSYCA